MIGVWIAVAGLVLALLAWLVWLSFELRRLVREAATVPVALARPETIRTSWSGTPHLLFRWGPARAAVAAVAASGFRVVGHRTEHAGAAHIRSVVLLSDDGTVEGCVGVWHLIPAGRIEAFTSFVSEAEDGTLLMTSAQDVRAAGLIGQAAPSDPLERLRRHRALVAAHPSPPRPLDPSSAACEARWLAIYQRRLVPAQPPRPVLRGVLDGRQAAKNLGLSVQPAGLAAPGPGQILDALTFVVVLTGAIQVARGHSALPWIALGFALSAARLGSRYFASRS